MPTKINRAGNQQNYVPAGNGDASGEYGDNANGSNKHFKAFKKPDDSNNTTGIEISTSEPKKPTKEQIIADEKEYMYNYLKERYEKNEISSMRYKMETRQLDNLNELGWLENHYKRIPEDRPQYNDFNKYINENTKNITNEFKNGISQDFSYGNDESKQFVFDLINHSAMRYNSTENDGDNLKYKNTSYFSPLDNQVFFSQKQYDEENWSRLNHSKGGTFYHETGHAIDQNFNYVDDGRFKQQFFGNMSEYYPTSTGKTLKQTLMGRKKWTIQQRLEDAKKDLKLFENDFYSKQSDEIKNAKKKLDGLYEEAKTSDRYKETLNSYNEYKEMFDKKINEYGSESAFSRKENYRYKVMKYNINNYEEDLENIQYNYKYEEQEKLRNITKSVDLEYNRAKNRTFGDLSDMFCMQGYGYAFGMGHPSSYAKDTGSRANEFFAECFSADATNPESVKLIKKYFPEGYKAYKEIVDAIKNGKIMTNEQHIIKERKVNS